MLAHSGACLMSTGTLGTPTSGCCTATTTPCSSWTPCSTWCSTWTPTCPTSSQVPHTACFCAPQLVNRRSSGCLAIAHACMCTSAACTWSRHAMPAVWVVCQTLPAAVVLSTHSLNKSFQGLAQSHIAKNLIADERVSSADCPSSCGVSHSVPGWDACQKAWNFHLSSAAQTTCGGRRASTTRTRSRGK